MCFYDSPIMNVPSVILVATYSVVMDVPKHIIPHASIRLLRFVYFICANAFFIMVVLTEHSTLKIIIQLAFFSYFLENSKWQVAMSRLLSRK